MLADILIGNPGEIIPYFRSYALMQMFYGQENHDQYLNRKDLEPGQFELS